jgi:four helix bundle protein
MQSDFRNLVVWQMAMDLADQIYDAADRLPKQERFVLSEQMRDAALSIPANIAEGKGRWSTREYRQFVRHARGSLLELQTHVLFAGRRRFLSAEHVAKLIARAEEVGQKLNALLRYLNRRARQPTRPTTHDPRPTAP